MPTPAEQLASLVRNDQELRYQRGERIAVEAYLQRHPELQSDEEAILTLIYNEVFLREQLGEQPGLEEYVGRFPHLAEQLRVQFEIHQAIVGESEPPAPGREVAPGLETVHYPPPSPSDADSAIENVSTYSQSPSDSEF